MSEKLRSPEGKEQQRQLVEESKYAYVSGHITENGDVVFDQTVIQNPSDTYESPHHFTEQGERIAVGQLEYGRARLLYRAQKEGARLSPEQVQELAERIGNPIAEIKSYYDRYHGFYNPTYEVDEGKRELVVTMDNYEQGRKLDTKRTIRVPVPSIEERLGIEVKKNK